ncbi:carbamoyl phosphate synthase large subunit, partial [Actinosynnema sp. NPDC051121]
GLLNVQYALKDDVLYVLEANPRASRTVPFVSKATAVPLAKAAARIMLGATVAQLRTEGLLPAQGDGAKLPPHAPVAVMAYAKSQTASYGSLPTSGRVFVSVANRDKRAMIFPVKRLADLGFEVLAATGTAEVLRRNSIIHTRASGDIIREIADGKFFLVVSTSGDRSPAGAADRAIREAASAHRVHSITTIRGLEAVVRALEAVVATGDALDVIPLQQAHRLPRA